MAEIYAITDDILTPKNTIISQVKELLDCGVKFIQFRTKKEPKDENIACKLLEICHKFDAKFIINDDINFAHKIGATAVHIGKDDGDIKHARKFLGKDAFIGVSCYNDLNLALKAQDKGASYVAFGAVFTSPTKPNAPLCDLETIRKAKEILSIPICTIGGINGSNIAQISELNIDMIAVISALYKPYSIRENYYNLVKFI